jgi:hypothetical protein
MLSFEFLTKQYALRNSSCLVWSKKTDIVIAGQARTGTGRRLVSAGAMLTTTGPLQRHYPGGSFRTNQSQGSRSTLKCSPSSCLRTTMTEGRQMRLERCRIGCRRQAVPLRHCVTRSRDSVALPKAVLRSVKLFYTFRASLQ